MSTKAEIGLLPRYHITKVNGNPMDPKADYFVLRVDSHGDTEHVKASLKALATYANEIETVLPQLAKDLREKYSLTALAPTRTLKPIGIGDPPSEFKIGDGSREKMFEAADRHAATSKAQADMIFGERTQHIFDRT